MNRRDPYSIMQDGIIYLFQYGYITEEKHFKMLNALDEKEIEGDDLMHRGKKF